MPLVQIIACSTREGRQGFPIAQWMEAVARKRGDVDVELIDLREVNLPLFDEPKHPRFGDYKHEHTRRWSATIRRGDGFVFVTPEYNNSFPASVKNAIDYLSAEWKYKPATFVSYGGVAAGTRAVQALRPVLNCFQMVSIYEAVNIPFFMKQLKDGRFVPEEGLEDSAKVMLDKLVFWMGRQASLYER
jgi:NAD(P)H-dependent FMN reductase